jgi:hypothetical protein
VPAGRNFENFDYWLALHGKGTFQQGLQIRAVLDARDEWLSRGADVILGNRNCTRQNLKTRSWINSATSTRSDMDIERYYMEVVIEQRERRALEIHLFGCPVCVDRAETVGRVYRRGSGRTEAVRRRGTIPQIASLEWTAALIEFCVTNRFQTRPRAIKWVLRWTQDRKRVPKAE